MSYAPRGVSKKVIALRLLAPELTKHESLAKQAALSSGAFARHVYLRGLKSLETAEPAKGTAPGMNTHAGVNRA